DGPAEVILAGQAVSWRQLAYYFPTQPMLVVESDGTVWGVEGTRLFVPVLRNGDYVLPGGLRTVIALDPTATTTRMLLENQSDFQSHGNLIYRARGYDGGFQ